MTTFNISPDASASPLLLMDRDVAKLLQVSPRTVANMKSRGKLSFVKIGRCVRYRYSDVQAFISNAKVMAG